MAGIPPGCGGVADVTLRAAPFACHEPTEVAAQFRLGSPAGRRRSGGPPVQRTGDAVSGPSLLGVSTTLTLTPLNDRGRELLDQLDASATPPFRYNDRTGARSYWRSADGVPSGGYEAELDRLEPDSVEP
jgi:hypothetical protein